MAAVMIERKKLQHENQNDSSYVQQLSSAFDQQQSFRLQQTRYLANQIPDLITSVEWTSLGFFNALGNDLIAAERCYHRAVEVAPDPASRLTASVGLAWFLFTRRRFGEAREVYPPALEQLTGSDRFARYQRGKAYLFWACNERDWASAPKQAENAFEAAAEEFRGIDIDAYRLSALHELEAAKNFTTPPQPPLTPKGT
jgi:tetratricopeptide (TPR) repeat protein